MSDREEEFENFIAQSFDFARNNDKNSLEIMLNAGLNVNLANHKGNTLLMLAAYNNSLDVAEMLLQKGAEVDKKKIDLKETIKTLGVHNIEIKLFEGVVGKLRIDVISE